MRYFERPASSWTSPPRTGSARRRSWRVPSGGRSSPDEADDDHDGDDDGAGDDGDDDAGPATSGRWTGVGWWCRAGGGCRGRRRRGSRLARPGDAVQVRVEQLALLTVGDLVQYRVPEVEVPGRAVACTGHPVRPGDRLVPAPDVVGVQGERGHGHHDLLVVNELPQAVRGALQPP